ncbi:MAG: hypothetical protein AB1589_13505 [Cyanobacteriota bacterium]
MLTSLLPLKYLTTTALSVGLLVLPVEARSSFATKLPQLFLAQAQPTPGSTSPEGAAIDRLFKSDSPPPDADSQGQRLFYDIKSFMGSYQAVQQEGNDYLATFDRGSLPVSVRLDSKGQIESISFGCPRSTSLDLSQASREIREMLSGCPGLHS